MMAIPWVVGCARVDDCTDGVEPDGLMGAERGVVESTAIELCTDDMADTCRNAETIVELTAAEGGVELSGVEMSGVELSGVELTT